MALESCRSQGTLAVSGRCGASTSLRTRAHLRGGGLSGGGTTDRLPACLTTLSVSTNVRQQKTPESSLRIIEDHNEQRCREPLGDLVEEGQKDLGRTPLSPFPVETLGPEMQSADKRGALTFGRSGDFGLDAFAKPSALDIGFIRKVRLIDPQDFYGALRLTGVDGGDNFCHPRFFVSGLGALRGTVLAKRL